MSSDFEKYYKGKLDDKSQENSQLSIFEFIGYNDKKYIPGSSIKGALRTAFVYSYFLENEKNKNKEDKLENSYILLIPNGFLHTKENKHFTKSSAFFTDFQVKKEELNTMLDEYAGVLE